MAVEKLTIVLTGGGSGGHITPLLAVADELKRLRPEAELLYIGQRGDSLADVPAGDPNIDEVFTIRAGKFRRYHGEGIRQLFDLPTVAKNIRDAWFVLIGIWQGYWLLRRLRPTVIFIKGGFVGVPVGLSAALLKVPFVTHDSDAIPGLANRIIARWASIHAVALPKEIYAYPQNKTVTVGVPISHRYHPYTNDQRVASKKRLGLAQYEQIILLTGGGNGAESLNHALAICVPELLKQYPKLAIIQLAGRSLEGSLNKKYNEAVVNKNDRTRIIVKGFVTELYDYSGIADVVITRAGGTSIAEFAAQGKACIVVPNPLLAGGHQLKNAKVLKEHQAVLLISEKSLQSNSLALLSPLVDLLDHPQKAHQLGEKLATIAQPAAARRLAMVLLEQTKK